MDGAGAAPKLPGVMSFQVQSAAAQQPDRSPKQLACEVRHHMAGAGLQWVY